MDPMRTMVHTPDEELESRDPLLIPASEVARLLNISKRTLWRLLSAGKLPAPVRLGNAVRWRREGWLRRSLRNLACLTLYGIGVPSRTIVRIYGR